MVDEAPAGAVELRWYRGTARFLAWGDASYAVILLLGIPVGAERGRLLPAVLLGALSVLPAWVARRAFAILRSPPPELRLHPTGDVELRHPLLAEPLVVAAVDVHSVWVGPFEQPPSTRRDWWIGMRRFPSHVLDVSDVHGSPDDDDALLVVFTRTLTLQPRLRIAPWVWSIQRMWFPMFRRTEANGLVGRVEDRQAAVAAVAAFGRTADAMPADVRAWLS